MDRGARWAIVHVVAESDMTERLRERERERERLIYRAVEFN